MDCSIWLPIAFSLMDARIKSAHGRRSYFLFDRALHRIDRRLIAPIHRPLPDALGAHEFRLRQHAHVLAHGRLADPELFGNEQAADAVLDQVAVELLAEMLPRLA